MAMTRLEFDAVGRGGARGFSLFGWLALACSIGCGGSNAPAPAGTPMAGTPGAAGTSAPATAGSAAGGGIRRCHFER